ncbi:MAG: hypothetical protein VW500_06515, partial [Aquiluna sp.]
WRDYPNRTSRTNPNYADNSFLKLKINYFLKLSYNENKKLVVWGAGKKGKKVAHILNELRVSFLWVCDNPKKIGKKIYENYLEDWQIIRYSPEELDELDIMPEDCTQSSVNDGTCGFGIRNEVEFVEFRTFNDPPLLKGIDMNPFTDVLHLELNPAFIEEGYSLRSFGCKVQLIENDILYHTYTQTVNELNCYFNIPEELQGDLYHLEIFTFVVFENIQSGQVKEIFRFMAEVGTND